jgi:hypothetical protein
MNIIVTIERPVLTPEERAKRMKAIKKAAADLVIATERKKGPRTWTETQKEASAS